MYYNLKIGYNHKIYGKNNDIISDDKNIVYKNKFEINNNNLIVFMILLIIKLKKRNKKNKLNKNSF